MKRTLVAHPFLLAVFPVLFLAAHNIEQMYAGVVGEIAVALAISIGFASASCFLLTFILKNKEKAGLIHTSSPR